MTVAGIEADRLRNIVQRIESLNAEKKQIADAIGDVYREAKSAGYDVPTLRQIIRERAKDADDVREGETLRELYRRALGMWDGTPLGAYSEAAE